MTATRLARRVIVLIAAALAIFFLATPDANAVVGRPLTPVSVAGVARRTTRRTMRRQGYYGGAYGAYGGAYAAPYAAPVAAPPVGCAPGVPCGGMTYQPAYSGANVVYVPQ